MNLMKIYPKTAGRTAWTESISWGKQFLIAVYVFLMTTGCQKPTDPFVPPGNEPAGNTMKIEYLWSDLERISLKLTKSKMDSSNTLSYILKRNEVNGTDLVIYEGG